MDCPQSWSCFSEFIVFLRSLARESAITPAAELAIARPPDLSVAGKLFCPNVILINLGAHKRLPHGRHHGGRPGNVIDGAMQDGQMSGQHLLVYWNGLALPLFRGFRH